MVAVSHPTHSSRFKVGWILLLALTVLMVLNHVVLIFVMTEPVLFLGWSAFNLYALTVLWFPFRATQKWAWYATWIMIAGFSVIIFFDAEIGWLYLSTAVLMALGM